MVSKKEIRKYVFAKRREITQEEADRRSLSIYEKVIITKKLPPGRLLKKPGRMESGWLCPR